jgi:outer membrane protein assembly factor BamB
MRSFFASLLLTCSVAALPAQPIDPEWPRWRGPKGDGFWEPKPLPADYATREPQRLWHTPVGKGYGGITVSGGRVYVMDRQTSPKELERVLCFDSLTGKLTWKHEWPVSYGEMGGYATGPRASVTIEDGKAYTLGATGIAACFDAPTGRVIWERDTVKDLGARIPQWGFAASPFIWKGTVLLHIGAEGQGSVVALDKATGTERWRSGGDPAGYCTPEIIEHEGQTQLIQWGPEHVQACDPDSGKALWTYPYKITYGVSIAQPLYRDGVLLVSGYWHGTKALRLGNKPKLLWENEKQICGLMSAPLFKDGLVYLLDKSNGLTCFQLSDGKILWQDGNQLSPKDRNPQLSIVWLDQSKGLTALLNASGELIYAKLTPEGADVLARHQIIGKTWAHPAFTKDTIFARSDTELAAWKLW